MVGAPGPGHDREVVMVLNRYLRISTHERCHHGYFVKLGSSRNANMVQTIANLWLV